MVSVASAATSSNTDSRDAGPPLSSNATISGDVSNLLPIEILRGELVDIKKEINEIKKRPEKPPKDIWDKISVFSGYSIFFSSILGAMIGIFVTRKYDQRERASQGRQKDQELLIARIQTAEKFIPHLSSEDERKKSAALVLISELGNDDLAINLAVTFGGPGAANALTTIATTAVPSIAEKAERALLEVLKYISPRVVTVYSGGIAIASGFVAFGDEYGDRGIVTTDHAICDISQPDFMIGLSDGRLVRGDLQNRSNEDLALLFVETNEQLPSFCYSASRPRVGDRVVALLIGPDASLGIHIGYVLIPEAGLATEQGAVQRVGVRFPVEPHSTGTPVLDSEGGLLGFVQATDREKNITLLIHASAAQTLVAPAPAPA